MFFLSTNVRYCGGMFIHWPVSNGGQNQGRAHPASCGALRPLSLVVGRAMMYCWFTQSLALAARGYGALQITDQNCPLGHLNPANYPANETENISTKP